MSGISINIQDGATPLLDRIRDAATSNGLVLVGGRAAANLIRDHLVALNSSRHRSGGTNFYANAAKSVTVTAVPQGAKVSITQTGFRQRLYGGPIDPTGGRKFLTIPACDEAIGKRASEFSDLEMRKVLNPATGSLQWALVRRPSETIIYRGRKGKDGVKHYKVSQGVPLEEQVMFWLVRHVDQAPDSSVLPTDDQIKDTALSAMALHFTRLRDRQIDPNGGDS